jgi:uncharacterized membrane protein YdfJ with MMPL/SSD domain
MRGQTLPAIRGGVAATRGRTPATAGPRAGTVPYMPTPTRFSLAGAVRRTANASARRPRITIVLWLVMVAALVVAGAMTGTRMLTGSESGTGDSARADALIDRAGLNDPAAETVLVRSGDRAATRDAVDALQARLRRLSVVGEVRPALDADGGRTALVELRLRGDPDDAADHVAPVESAVAAVGRDHPQVTLAQAGDGTFENAFNDLLESDFKRANTVSLPITLVILVIAFGAIVAACVPLLLGVTSVAAALGAAALISQLVPSIESASALIAVIGLAVGVDYSLFYIRREREERLAGKGPHAALDAAAATVGRAIVVSGVTVMVALAGLLLTGLSVFTAMALGTIVVVAIAVIGSVTVLPATLALLGDRVNKGRLPFLRLRLRRRRAGRGAWARLAQTVTRRPLAALVCAVCVLAALAVPALDMHAANSGLSALPADTPTLVAERAIEKSFPGAPSDAELVVRSKGLDTPAARQRLRSLGERARAITHGRGSISVDVSLDGSTAVVAVPMPDRGVDAAEKTVAQLRASVGDEALVTGMAAGGSDFTQRLTSRTPFVIAAVLGLAMLLLIAAFRSPGLAAAVIGLNLLSVGAAYGVLVAVFQHTWAESLLGFTSSGTIADWLPLFAFVILFGLSMDYTILVLERIREARLNGRSAREAAAEGVAATASTVTSAAIVMVAVFAIFATMRFTDNKELGVGLSVAILLDATVVRGIALPAVVALLGERGWRVRPRRAAARAWDDGRPARVATATAVVSSSRDAR